MRQFLIFFYSVSNTWLKSVIFPPKDLEKNTGAQNTHAPFFFKKKCVKDFITHICILLLSNKIKLNNVLVWFLFSFLNYFIQSISNQLSNFPSKKNSLKYILRLLAGKFGWICTEFPLATFSAKNWKWIPLNFSAKSFNANYQKILFSNNSLRQILLSEFFFFLHKRISTHYYYFNNKQHGKLVYYKLACFNVSLF